MSERVESILGRLSVEQKIGQCVVIGMSGTTVSNDLREAIERFQCGGIRLSPFARTFGYFSDEKAKKQELGSDYVPCLEKRAKQGPAVYVGPERYAAVLNELRACASKRSPVPLHMVVDQEGDTSKDIACGGFIQFPSNLGIASSKDPRLAYAIALALAKQLKACGVDMIHSPVVDVNINPANPEIGRRAFGDDPLVVAEFAVAMMKGFKDGGVIAAAKHFPGRGDSSTDAHHATPTLDVDLKRLHAVELYPYKQLIAAGIDAMMVAHCVYPALDSEIATVSRKVLTGLLRQELGFKGMITTDSMTMGALIDKYGIGESCARALYAGADVILMKAENQWRGEMFYTIAQWVRDGKIPVGELDDKVRRILTIKEQYGLFDRMGAVDAAKAAVPYRDPAVVELSEKAARKAIIVPKDELGAIPLDPRKRMLLINQLNSIKSPNDLWDHPALLQGLMEEEFRDLQTLETAFGFDETEERRILEFLAARAPYEVIVCTNWYDRSEKPQTYVKTLIARGYPVVLLTNDPYNAKGVGGMIPSAKTIVLDMNLTPAGLKAARDVLVGRLAPEGQWPLLNYDPLGPAKAGGLPIKN